MAQFHAASDEIALVQRCNFNLSPPLVVTTSRFRRLSKKRKKTTPERGSLWRSTTEIEIFSSGLRIGI